MRFTLVIFVVMLLIIGNILCHVMEGSWIDTDDQSQMNALVGHEIKSAVNIPIITPIINWAKEFWRTVSWDFVFLDPVPIVRWCLFALSAGVIYAAVQEFRGSTTSIFSRR